jgi:hypothetical protein
MLKEDEQILLRFQVAKTKLDGLKLFGLAYPEAPIDGPFPDTKWISDIWTEHFKAREELKSVPEAGIAGLAAIACQELFLPDDPPEEEWQRARSRQNEVERAEQELLEISLKIADYRPECMRLVN